LQIIGDAGLRVNEEEKPTKDPPSPTAAAEASIFASASYGGQDGGQEAAEGKPLTDAFTAENAETTEKRRWVSCSFNWDWGILELKNYNSQFPITESLNFHYSIIPRFHYSFFIPFFLLPW
jgi:hypothetical protein